MENRGCGLELRPLPPYPNGRPGASPYRQERDASDAAGCAEVLEQLRGRSIAATSIEASGGGVISCARAARREPAPGGAIRFETKCAAQTGETARDLRLVES